MNISLEYYKVFYHVAKLGSISAAANQLFISQPAVSQAIKHLESALGANLFLRTSKGVKLTAEGEMLYRTVSQGYDYFAMAESMFRDIHHLEAGEIRIGASDMTLQFYLLPYLEQFHAKYPKIKISVTNGPTPETIKALRAGDIDFGVVTTPVISDKWMIAQPVRRIQDCFVAGVKFTALKHRTLSLEELAQMPLTMLEKRTSSRRYIDALFVQNGYVVRPEFELATSELIVQFALRGLGIGYVVQDFAQPYLERGELFKLQLSEAIAPRNMCLITPTKYPVPAAGKRLLESLHTDSGTPAIS